MGEAFAIFGAINGAIGVSLTVRNGIETIYGDVHTFKHIRRELKVKRLTMQTLDITLVDWRDKWMIWDEEEHSSLHHYLWGDRFILIYNLLSSITAYLDSLNRKLEAAPRSRIRRFGSALSYVFTKKVLVGDLGELERMVTSLKTQAETAFRTKHQNHIYGVDGTRSSGLIHWIGEAFQLVGLAEQTYISSEDLYKACVESKEELVLDLGLNFFHKEPGFQEFGSDWGKEQQRSKARLRAIFASAKQSKLHFTFLAKEMRPSDHLIRVHIKNDSSLEQQEYQRSVPRAFESIFSREKTKSGFDIPREVRAHRFVICDTPDTGTWASACLRTELSRPQPPNHHDRNMAQDSINLMKVKAALELVEGGLLFLRTSWFSRLCSCFLRRQGASLPERIHTFRITEVQHVKPRFEDRIAANCWCSEEDRMRDMYIRRLGVLLVELALEMPVFDVGFAANSSGLELSFPRERVNFAWPAQQERREDWNETRDRLKKAGVEEAYVEVVKYCLDCTWTRDQVSERRGLLDDYYWKILHP